MSGILLDRKKSASSAKEEEILIEDSCCENSFQGLKEAQEGRGSKDSDSVYIVEASISEDL